MALFKRKTQGEAPFPPEKYEPVLRCSICTGEQTACMRDRSTGKLAEIMLIRSPADLAEFRRKYRIAAEELEKLY